VGEQRGFSSILSKEYVRGVGGRIIYQFQERRWLKKNEKKMKKIVHLFQQMGRLEGKKMKDLFHKKKLANL
jgi:hypothetical protein